jgi:hypothetical protein
MNMDSPCWAPIKAYLREKEDMGLLLLLYCADNQSPSWLDIPGEVTTAFATNLRAAQQVLIPAIQGIVQTYGQGEFAVIETNFYVARGEHRTIDFGPRILAPSLLPVDARVVCRVWVSRNSTTLFTT